MCYQEFSERGVILHQPQTLALDVVPEQIAPGVEIFPGCRIGGAGTSIAPGCRIGAQGPVTLEDCQLGRDVSFASGFAQEATLLDGVTIGANAHIRPGTLLEEQVTLAHCVGLKQTLLLPFVTLGSLINFCDCLMAGGTSRFNHSEVGSSFVHFNFTPRQDKATPSLFGDIPQGVLLDQSPIFLGGQGGAVGPLRMAYGTIQAAGTISRRDVHAPGTLIHPLPPAIPPGAAFDPRRFGNLDRVVANNCIYIGNLQALKAWYEAVRVHTRFDDTYGQACWQGAITRLRQMLSERIRQLGKLADRLVNTPQPHAAHAWLLGYLEQMDPDGSGVTAAPPAVLRDYVRMLQRGAHIEGVQAMPADVKLAASSWLQTYVDAQQRRWEQISHGEAIRD